MAKGGNTTGTKFGSLVKGTVWGRNEGGADQTIARKGLPSLLGAILMFAYLAESSILRINLCDCGRISTPEAEEFGYGY
jgi:hypothetical protein